MARLRINLFGSDPDPLLYGCGNRIRDTKLPRIHEPGTEDTEANMNISIPAKEKMGARQTQFKTNYK